MGISKSSPLFAGLNRQLSCMVTIALFSLPVGAQVTITSPAQGSTSISAVKIVASANESDSFHLEIWDNGYKLGNVIASSVNGVYVLPNGSHTLTINAVTSSGTVLNGASVTYNVAENCTNSSSVECDMDQQGINDAQDLNDPPGSTDWTANPDGAGIQGSGDPPTSTGIQYAQTSGTLPDMNNTSLNGNSLELSETQATGGYSNVIFSADSPNNASSSTIDTHWTLDEYVMLPVTAANQAFEVDAQYVISGVWTKFYTECAFNEQGVNPDGSAGVGYWGVFDSNTGGWIFLNGETQDGQTPPSVPCTYAMFQQPWQGSSYPNFNGWHHIVWNFVRNSSNGSVTFASVTVDNNTSQINYNPPSDAGGTGTNAGSFGALVQLDGIANPNGQYDTVNAYVNELDITHTP